MKTLVVNLFAGPGSGKSTICAAIFAQLKWKGINCEMAMEFAKDLVWQDHLNTLSNQMYVFGEQQHRIFRLNGKVEVIITDSPLLLSAVYAQKDDLDLRKVIVNEFKKYNNLNFFIDRAKPYEQRGRLQTFEGAKQKDEEVIEILNDNNISFEIIKGSPENVDVIVDRIIENIKLTK